MKAKIFKELSAKKYAPLTREKELELLRRAKAGDKEAEKELVERNLRYVAKMAAKYARPDSDTFYELISAGTIGLYKAIEKFDLEKNTRFLTFATFYVFHEMYKVLTQELSILSFPASIKRVVIFLYRRVPELEKELGRLPEVSEIMEEIKKKFPKMEIPQELVENILRKKHIVVSLDELVEDRVLLESLEQSDLT